MIRPLSAFTALVQSLPWKPGIKYSQEADVKDRKAAGRGVSQQVSFYLSHWGTPSGNVKCQVEREIAVYPLGADQD